MMADLLENNLLKVVARLKHPDWSLKACNHIRPVELFGQLDDR